MSNFYSTALSCDPACFPVKIGHREERGNKINPWFWYIWRAQQLKFFRTSSYFFSILTIFREKRAVKVGPKMLSFGPSLFHKNSDSSKNFQTNLLFARVQSLVRILAILDYIWGSQDPNISQKGPLGAESVSKTLKIFNLTTASAILMKLTTIMYLLQSVNRKALRARNSAFWLNF